MEAMKESFLAETCNACAMNNARGGGGTKNRFLNRILPGFSIGELLIALGIIGVLVMILMPILSKAKPDENEVLHKKATFIVERVVNELSTDEFLYPKSSEYQGLSNTSPVVINGESHFGTTKFCTLFASRINKAANTTVNCTNGQKSVTSVEGIDWYLPVSDFKNADYETIKVDVNGSKGPNCMVKSKTCYHPDQFEYKIKRGTKLSVKNIENMDATAPPAARPIMPDEPTGNTTDPRTGQNWYCIRCNPTTNGSVYGYGCNKPNGHYQLVAIPKIGYKGSWFTKSVTVNNADVPASECNVTFTPIVDIPTPDGPTPPPTPTPTPDPTPEKTYCINVTKTGGDVTQCAVAGDGCNKKPGTYIVSASGKGDYKTSWSTKNVTIENIDVNLTLVCDKDPEPDPCYSITTTGDTTNCPVTLPSGTCKTDKTKYTSGTYSYTVTPKEGYIYNKVTEASTKQVMVTDKDASISIDCTVAPAETKSVRWIKTSDTLTWHEQSGQNAVDVSKCKDCGPSTVSIVDADIDRDFVYSFINPSLYYTLRSNGSTTKILQFKLTPPKGAVLEGSDIYTVTQTPYPEHTTDLPGFISFTVGYSNMRGNGAGSCSDSSSSAAILMDLDYSYSCPTFTNQNTDGGIVEIRILAPDGAQMYYTSVNVPGCFPVPGSPTTVKIPLNILTRGHCGTYYINATSTSDTIKIQYNQSWQSGPY